MSSEKKQYKLYTQGDVVEIVELLSNESAEQGQVLNITDLKFKINYDSSNNTDLILL